MHWDNTHRFCSLILPCSASFHSADNFKWLNNLRWRLGQGERHHAMHSNCVVRILYCHAPVQILILPALHLIIRVASVILNLTSSKEKHRYNTVQDRHTASEYNCKVGSRYTGFHAAFTTYTRRFDTGFLEHLHQCFFGFFVLVVWLAPLHMVR